MVVSEASPIAVLYADAQLAVVDKPAGLMVHDSALARGETEFALDRLRAQFGRRVYFAHRLDRATRRPAGAKLARRPRGPVRCAPCWPPS